MTGTLPNARALPLPESTRKLHQLNQQYSVGGINSVAVYFASGKGATLIDSEGRELLDFVNGFSSTNLGQCHPRIVAAQVNTANKITLANIGGMSQEWPVLAEKLCRKFGYDKVAAAVTGSEAADTACKLARGWGINVKKIDPQDVLVLGTSENYHGTITGVWPLMEPGAGQEVYGTFSKNLTNINPKTGKVLRYLHAEDYAEIFEQMGERIAAVIMEPLHGLAKSKDDEVNFCIKVRQLCKKHNILYIADEIRMGSCKTGKFLSSDWLGPENKPDMVTIGKSISGGAYPASFILGPDEVMGQMKPYHGIHTFAMTSMACATVLAALEVYEEEKLHERALAIQEKWVKETSTWDFPYLKYCPSYGADFSLVLDLAHEGITSRRFCLLSASKGLLSATGPNGRVRLGASLIINDEDLLRGFQIIKETLADLPNYGQIEGSEVPLGAF
ncbi:unnamed protein product [Clonostachys byssicola]|uniref:Ornithine aminotransferase n=1 Tax=Clonostachys byssicola TaxID=160290 RepID=A0A9N9XZM9_9HYPO|nr:unnamed protein product [Clonostachys byssicola]